MTKDSARKDRRGAIYAIAVGSLTIALCSSLPSLAGCSTGDASKGAEAESSAPPADGLSAALTRDGADIRTDFGLPWGAKFLPAGQVEVVLPPLGDNGEPQFSLNRSAPEGVSQSAALVAPSPLWVNLGITRWYVEVLRDDIPGPGGFLALRVTGVGGQEGYEQRLFSYAAVYDGDPKNRYNVYSVIAVNGALSILRNSYDVSYGRTPYKSKLNRPKLLLVRSDLVDEIAHIRSKLRFVDPVAPVLQPVKLGKNPDGTCFLLYSDLVARTTFVEREIHQRKPSVVTAPTPTLPSLVTLTIQQGAPPTEGGPSPSLTVRDSQADLEGLASDTLGLAACALQETADADAGTPPADASAPFDPTPLGVR